MCLRSARWPQGSNRQWGDVSISSCSTRRRHPWPIACSGRAGCCSSTTMRHWSGGRRAPSSSTWTSSPSKSCARPAFFVRQRVVDKALLATKIAIVRDAVTRVRAVLPPDARAFREDRTAREIVILNLFVALQACLDLSAHWLADEG